MSYILISSIPFIIVVILFIGAKKLKSYKTSKTEQPSIDVYNPDHSIYVEVTSSFTEVLEETYNTNPINSEEEVNTIPIPESKPKRKYVKKNKTKKK